MKSLLLISRHSPYGSSYAHEALDIALSAAAFDVSVSLLFLDDGVYQLMKGQQLAKQANSKNLEAVFGALPLYDINALWAERESLDARNIKPGDLAHPAKALASEQIADFSSGFDRVLTI